LRRLGNALAEPIDIDGTILHPAVLDEHEFFPAAGQGAIGFETRKGDESVAEILRTINDHPTWMRVRAEREFLRLLDAGCHTPVGVLSEWSHERLVLAARVFPEQGGAPWVGEVRGDPADPEAVAQELFDRMPEESSVNPPGRPGMRG
jgi:hydroxymethylbilane synthase